ncbi:GntR family transcriptional regulator [Mesobacterium pallidum]|uniref:GntR family transcriptional regulator n=1 Tax=Mesobacterium pallidum TaxID=2872037 RepID=UPI001EE37AB9|nr:GntR family transcriptional regulator [Mesobacterium pallidum]
MPSASPTARLPDTLQDQTIASRVYEALRARIVALDLPPGARLSRPELAEMFGVSASPLREALQRLERDGLVATFRQSRTVVTHLDAESLRQEHFLRTAIECEVANALAALPDKAALAKTAAILKMQRALAGDPDQVDLFRQLDEDFHRALFVAAGFAELHGVVLQGSNQMARLRTLDLPSEGKRASVIEGHAALLEAIMSGDRHAATDAMRAHLSGTIARLPEIMVQYPQHFA